MDAAREVAGADVDLDLLESLLDKSLLRHRLNGVGQDRYWMLETIREYAARHLAADDEETTSRVVETSSCRAVRSSRRLRGRRRACCRARSRRRHPTSRADVRDDTRAGARRDALPRLDHIRRTFTRPR